MVQSPLFHRVLVYGANGVQGNAIALALHAAGHEVRAVVRDAAKATPLREAGIATFNADLSEPTSLVHASQGVDAVALTLPLEFDAERMLGWARHAIHAAREASVRLLVVNSASRIPSQVTSVPAFELRREIESMALSSGLPCICLRPPLFMENLAMPASVRSVLEHGTVAYPLPKHCKVAWLSVSDLGAYVVAALRRPDLRERIVNIGGPSNLDGVELARELTRGLARPVSYVALAPQAFEENLAGSFGGEVAAWVARSYHWIAEHPDSVLFTAEPHGLLDAELPHARLHMAAWAPSAFVRGP